MNVDITSKRMFGHPAHIENARSFVVDRVRYNPRAKCSFTDIRRAYIEWSYMWGLRHMIVNGNDFMLIIDSVCSTKWPYKVHVTGSRDCIYEGLELIQ